MSRRTTHTTRVRGVAYKKGHRPLSSSLSINRSQRFPDRLLEIPLAMLWLKQTFRPGTITYALYNYLPTSHRLQPINYSYVCAIISTASHQPHTPTITRTVAYLPVAPVTAWSSWAVPAMAGGALALPLNSLAAASPANWSTTSLLAT